VVQSEKNQIAPNRIDHFVIWSSTNEEEPDPGIKDKWPYTQKDKIELIYGPFPDNSRRKVTTKYIFFYKGVP